MNQSKQRKAVLEPEPPQMRAVDTYGERRPPQGDRKHYDKHGGKLDHDGKRAQSESTAQGRSGGHMDEHRISRTGNQQPLPHDDENAKRQREVPPEAKEERMAGRRRS